MYHPDIDNIFGVCEGAQWSNTFFLPQSRKRMAWPPWILHRGSQDSAVSAMVLPWSPSPRVLADIWTDQSLSPVVEWHTMPGRQEGFYPCWRVDRQQSTDELRSIFSPFISSHINWVISCQIAHTSKSIHTYTFRAGEHIKIF